MSAPSPQLSRRRLGVMHIVFFSVAAVAPLAVVGGVVTATYAVTGVTGVPLSFIILAAALALFAVGYAAMSRHVANAGAFYSYLAHGLGAVPAVGGAFVALVAYNSLQIGIYGLYGAAFADLIESLTGLSAPWWVWAAVALLLVALLGVRRVDLNARVLAVLLVLECIVVVVYDIGAFGNPATDAPTLGAAFSPSSLFVPGVAAVFAFGVTAFIGFEAGAIYSEECRNPRVTVARATFIAVGFVGVFYAVSSWAMLVTVGPANIQQASTEECGFGARGARRALGQHGVHDCRDAVPHQQLRRAAQLPQRCGPLPVRARPRAGAAERARSRGSPLRWAGRWLAGPECAGLRRAGCFRTGGNGPGTRRCSPGSPGSRQWGSFC